MIARRVAMLAAALAALSGGCELGSGPASHAGSSTSTPVTGQDTLELVRMETYRGHGITFTYPAAWRFRRAGFYSTMTSPVIDLASQPTRNPCVRGAGCGFPARRLRPGAVVVIWDQGGGLVDPARPPHVGVRVRVVHRGCRAIGGGDELTALVVLRGRRVYEAAACFRGPDVALHESEARMMFASARAYRP